jgi:Ca2+/Na+ antiporter
MRRCVRSMIHCKKSRTRTGILHSSFQHFLLLFPIFNCTLIHSIFQRKLHFFCFVLLCFFFFFLIPILYILLLNYIFNLFYYLFYLTFRTELKKLENQQKAKENHSNLLEKEMSAGMDCNVR